MPARITATTTHARALCWGHGNHPQNAAGNRLSARLAPAAHLPLQRFSRGAGAGNRDILLRGVDARNHPDERSEIPDDAH